MSPFLILLENRRKKKLFMLRLLHLEKVVIMASIEGKLADEGEIQSLVAPPRPANNTRVYKQCFICKKFGNMEAHDWYKNKKVNVSKEAKDVDEGLLFMASNESINEARGT